MPLVAAFIRYNETDGVGPSALVGVLGGDTLPDGPISEVPGVGGDGAVGRGRRGGIDGYGQGFLPFFRIYGKGGPGAGLDDIEIIEVGGEAGSAAPGFHDEADGLERGGSRYGLGVGPGWIGGAAVEEVVAVTPLLDTQSNRLSLQESVSPAVADVVDSAAFEEKVGWLAVDGSLLSNVPVNDVGSAVIQNQARKKGRAGGRGGVGDDPEPGLNEEVEIGIDGTPELEGSIDASPGIEVLTEIACDRDLHSPPAVSVILLDDRVGDAGLWFVKFPVAVKCGVVVKVIIADGGGGLHVDLEVDCAGSAAGGRFKLYVLNFEIFRSPAGKSVLSGVVGEPFGAIQKGQCRSGLPGRFYPADVRHSDPGRVRVFDLTGEMNFRR